MLRDFNNIESFEKSSDSGEDNKPISLSRKTIAKTKDKIKDIFRLIDEKIANKKEIQKTINLMKEKQVLLKNAKLKIQWKVFFDRAFDSFLISNIFGFSFAIYLDVFHNVSEIIGDTSFLVYIFTLSFLVLMPIVMLITYKYNLKKVDSSIDVNRQELSKLFELDSKIEKTILKKLDNSKNVLGETTNIDIPTNMEMLLKELYKTNDGELNIHINECVSKYVKKMDFSEFEKEMSKKYKSVVHSEILQELDSKVMDIILENGKSSVITTVTNNPLNNVLSIGGFNEFK